MATKIEEVATSSGVGRIRDAMKPVAEDIEDTAQNLKKEAYNAGMKLREKVNDLYEQADDVRHKIEDRIRERPFLSSLALFTAGMITAKIMSRK